MLNAAALVDENAVYGLLHVYVYSFKESRVSSRCGGYVDMCIKH